MSDDDTDREFLRAVFGQDAELYDRSRPGYPERMFADLAELAGLTAHSRVLEIGCGTGQATRALALLGCTVVGVELSSAMAAVARRNLAGFPGVTVEIGAFEDWTPPVAPFDLVLAATAFHWVDPAVRVRKAAEVLRPGGALAVVHSEHVAGGTERFFVDAQSCYERFDPKTTPGLRLKPAADIPREASEIDRSGRFDAAVFRRYEWEQVYPTSAYLDLLMTYSGHRALERKARNALFACLQTLIDRDHQGRISKRYLTQVTFARLSPSTR
ncbi:class I SAM-dependent methyltransferase [Actinoplanes sp. NPDC051494]|uniref:class I SAM-dependent methyltransferase n=1 Tax=Actinoplanes sp. NPDC051494 TaxID=3363907 RepID=UPI0037A95A06